MGLQKVVFDPACPQHSFDWRAHFQPELHPPGKYQDFDSLIQDLGNVCRLDPWPVVRAGPFPIPFDRTARPDLTVFEMFACPSDLDFDITPGQVSD